MRPPSWSLLHSVMCPSVAKILRPAKRRLRRLLPGIKTRLLGLNGWFSTNILGNRDGEVLDDPGSFKTKEESKPSRLFCSQSFIRLHKDYYHKVASTIIHHMGIIKRMEISTSRVGWDIPCNSRLTCVETVFSPHHWSQTLCPLDLVQARVLAVSRNGRPLFQGPMTAPGLYPEHDLFIQKQSSKIPSVI